jgi:hypothetical protein
MMIDAKAVAAAFFVLVVTGCRSEPAQFSGTWSLNVERSTWGSVTRPASVVVSIDHREPALAYSGVVTYSNEDVRPFQFEGAIDGKQYPVTRSCGAGHIVIWRTSPRSVSSMFRSEDGRCVESAETSITRSGTRIIRRLHSTAPSGVRSWTEVYDRQPGG